jgi:hypothetical protein
MTDGPRVIAQGKKIWIESRCEHDVTLQFIRVNNFRLQVDAIKSLF